MTLLTKRILGWISFGVGLLIMTFFRRYTGDIIPYPWLFYVTGLFCFFVGFFLIRKTPTISENKIREKARLLIKDLKENGDKVLVELNNCEIKENHYYQEPDNFRNATDLELLTAKDLIYLYNKMNTRASDSQIYQSVAVCRINYKGKEKVFYSSTISKDKDNLLFKFSSQKTTSLYIDKFDCERYYFDIEFIYE